MRSKEMARKMLPAVNAFFASLGPVPKATKEKVEGAMWALLDELGVDLDEFARIFEAQYQRKR